MNSSDVVHWRLLSPSSPHSCTRNFSCIAPGCLGSAARSSPFFLARCRYLALSPQVEKCTSTDQAKAAAAAVRGKLHYAALTAMAELEIYTELTEGCVFFPTIYHGSSQQGECNVLVGDVRRLPTSNSLLKKTMQIRDMFIYI